ncbi:DNA topoisomerase [Shouchella clausii]|uniref:type IA DNA topoisomerase n=1 Tax=Shouchella clausii TaxID=79880 RepID=UPI001B085550|nr:type IA DNA topoisomerase [Shouchella clausii]GIN17702.1 DNA topoisomerase [Shouchella clausii]
MDLILAEKPSVAKNIADALEIKAKKDGYYEGDAYLITWAFGHLLELYDAKDYDPKFARWQESYFPFIPTQFKYKVKSTYNKPDTGAKKQLAIISRLARRHDVRRIISACDYDREGQLIGDSIISNLRADKPVFRMLLNEWTKQEVLRGLKHARPNSELITLRDAGVSRQWADWAIGINLTSVATLKYQPGRGSVLNIGRVLLPTLKIIYDRDKEIAAFTPERYYKLVALFQTAGGATYEGVYTCKKQTAFSEKQGLEQVASLLPGKLARAVHVERNEKKEYPPVLFNLSQLQGHITNKYKGWTADKVLKIAQSLYEKKLITYPRTSSTALEESLVKKTAAVLKAISKGLPYEKDIRFTTSKRIFNNAKVESHSAIIPTYMLPKRLNTEEAIVYNAVKNRFLMQFMPPAEFLETTIHTKLEEGVAEGFFVSKGREKRADGWHQVEQVNGKETFLPNVEEGERVKALSGKTSDHMTTPPKPHTEKTLLHIMETCGRKLDKDDAEQLMKGYAIGTAATRADTIKKLKDIGYIHASGKALHCTETGAKLVEQFPVQRLFDLAFTGRLEKQLFDIEKGRLDKQSFLQSIFAFIETAVQEIKADETGKIESMAKTKKRQVTETLGKCPLCEKPVIETNKAFGCSGWKSGCPFVIWKNDKYLARFKKKPTKTMVKSLLKHGFVNVKGLKSKNGKTFSATLRYQQQGNYFSWVLEFPKRGDGQ